jgi:hypothetical protein
MVGPWRAGARPPVSPEAAQSAAPIAITGASHRKPHRTAGGGAATAWMPSLASPALARMADISLASATPATAPPGGARPALRSPYSYPGAPPGTTPPPRPPALGPRSAGGAASSSPSRSRGGRATPSMGGSPDAAGSHGSGRGGYFDGGFRAVRAAGSIASPESLYSSSAARFYSPAPLRGADL